MDDNRGEGSSPDAQQQQQPPQLPPSPPDSLHDEPSEPFRQTGVVQTPPFLPIYVPISGSPSPAFEHHRQFEAVNPKRPRFGVGQWKVLTSPPHPQQQLHLQKQTLAMHMAGASTESTPSPSATHSSHPPTNPQTVSSSDTASSPSHSPIPSLLEVMAKNTNPESEARQHHQFRKGKYVSPVWKPNEMLWLARAWRIQYQGGGSSDSTETPSGGDEVGVQFSRGKTRAQKDREVAEFLNRHGVNRDAKTVGTKWDNMLGEFRKVYEWEKGGEREQLVGKSYFRLSPYERKLHRLPASFDEEVFEELCQFMGPRMRSSPRGLPSIIASGETDASGIRALPQPPSFKDDDPLSPAAGRSRQLAVISDGDERFFPRNSRSGGILGFNLASDVRVASTSSTTAKKELHRIGKVRMTWEESVSLWAEEEREHHWGRIMVRSLSFLNADELAYIDDSAVACTLEAFEEESLKGFSVDRFSPGQLVRILGRRKTPTSQSSTSSGSAYGGCDPSPIQSFSERVGLPWPEASARPIIPPLEFQDPTEYFVGCLRVSPTTLPSLSDLSRYLQEPLPEQLRFPLRKDVYRDLPAGKELFFTTSTNLDCRSITYEILSSLVRPYECLTSPTASASRDSFIDLWDSCINRPIAKFCSAEIIMLRKPSAYSPSSSGGLQDQWPNMTGFIKNLCLWRGEETGYVREGQLDPGMSLSEKMLWTYADLPYSLGYYAGGPTVTFCALSRSQQDARVVRTDVCTFDMSAPTERLKLLVPCYRIAGLLSLLSHRSLNSVHRDFIYSDFERIIDLGNGSTLEMTPNTVTKFFPSRRKWSSVKEIYDFLDHRVPHAEFVHQCDERELSLVFRPRGCRLKPASFEQLVEALMCVTKALVALHDLSFMHRQLGWDRVARTVDGCGEWFVCGFDEAAGSPQIYPHGDGRGGGQAPEMGRGLHSVKVDVWGLGYLVKTCGLASGMAKPLRELQDRCMEANPELRPSAADCYRVLSQLQSSAARASSGSGFM